MEANVKRNETAKIDRDCDPFATPWVKTKRPTYDTFSIGRSVAKVGENRGRGMRDIRSDLLERVDLMEDRIKAAHAQCEEKIKQLQAECDAKVGNLKSSIAMLAKLLEFEQQEHTGNVPSVVTPPTSPLLSLADFVERMLIEKGPLSQRSLNDLVVQEGYFPDAQSAAQTVEVTLRDIVERKRVCPLPDGTFALPMLSPAAKLKLVV
jgi:hypothetical protein